MSFDLVLFGGTGDLAWRKLMPALFQAFRHGTLPAGGRIIGIGRDDLSAEQYRARIGTRFDQVDLAKRPSTQEFTRFAALLEYVRMDLSRPDDYTRLAATLRERQTDTVVMYVATAPSLFTTVCEQLACAGLNTAQTRVVLEKPLGHDLASNRAINETVGRVFSEKQVFRIDHYLGKETVQNILTFRFANSIFERLWNRDAVDHIQITVSEKLGVGSRGGYYEEAGALRDMLQNHLMQVLALVTMEPPVSLDAEPVRDEKVKLLSSLRRLRPDQVAANVVRGQYREGFVAGEAQAAYRSESKVNPQSNVETFVAAKLFIDNWRWAGVPIYLRTGKALPLSASEVRVQFKPTPNVLFAAQCGPLLDANALTLRLQPDEGISLRFTGKVPGVGYGLRPVRMHFSYDSEFGAYTPEAYERLLLDAIIGDATLFIRRDEVEQAWEIVDSIRAGWDGLPLDKREFYPAGNWGPHLADELLTQSGRAWREPRNP